MMFMFLIVVFKDRTRDTSVFSFHLPRIFYTGQDLMKHRTGFKITDCNNLKEQRLNIAVKGGQHTLN